MAYTSKIALIFDFLWNLSYLFWVPAWDYSPQDDSFIFIEEEGVEARGNSSWLTELVVVENWFKELETLAQSYQV